MSPALQRSQYGPIGAFKEAQLCLVVGRSLCRTFVPYRSLLGDVAAVVTEDSDLLVCTAHHAPTQSAHVHRWPLPPATSCPSLCGPPAAAATYLSIPRFMAQVYVSCTRWTPAALAHASAPRICSGHLSCASRWSESAVKILLRPAHLDHGSMDQWSFTVLLQDFTEDMIRTMCILAGCDYLPNLQVLLTAL